MQHSSDSNGFLSEAFQGEVLGEALFALLAEREDEADRVAQWRRLEHLERHVKARLRAELKRLGGPVGEDPAKRGDGRNLAVGLSALGADAAGAAIAAEVRNNIERTRKALTTLSGKEEAAARFYLGHQRAIVAYLDSQGAAEDPKGEADDPVKRFLEETGAAPEAPIPEGVQLMPLDPTYQADPAAVHAEIQRRAPVHRDRQINNLTVSGHDVVRRIAYDLDFLVDPRKAREDDPVRMFLNDRADREPSMLFLDDPEHNRLRNLVSRSFTPRAVERLRPLVEEVTAELLDAIESEGTGEFDLIERLAAPLPAIAIARILGVDASQQAQFKAWSVASSEAFFDPFASEAVKALGLEAQECLERCFRSEIAKRRDAPADDLIGKLVAAEREGDRLDENEIVTMCGLLLIAGNVTTTDLIGNGVYALL
jgi:hypothetical protein